MMMMTHPRDDDALVAPLEEALIGRLRHVVNVRGELVPRQGVKPPVALDGLGGVQTRDDLEGVQRDQDGTCKSGRGGGEVVMMVAVPWRLYMIV
jgi:hypothetical protein